MGIHFTLDLFLRPIHSLIPPKFYRKIHDPVILIPQCLTPDNTGVWELIKAFQHLEDSMFDLHRRAESGYNLSNNTGSRNTGDP